MCVITYKGPPREVNTRSIWGFRSTSGAVETYRSPSNGELEEEVAYVKKKKCNKANCAPNCINWQIAADDLRW
jgi:hypothetical protein